MLFTGENDVSESHGEEVELESELVADVKVVRGQEGEEEGDKTGVMGFMKTLVGNNGELFMNLNINHLLYFWGKNKHAVRPIETLLNISVVISIWLGSLPIR